LVHEILAPIRLSLTPRFSGVIPLPSRGEGRGEACDLPIMSMYAKHIRSEVLMRADISRASIQVNLFSGELTSAIPSAPPWLPAEQKAPCATHPALSSAWLLCL